MLFLPAALLLPLALATSLNAVEQRADSSCPAAHVILARGNDEPYPGRQGALVTAICSRFSTCDYEDIIYDDPTDPVYCHAVNNGTINGVHQLTAYVRRCPYTNIILSGYSQGGQVIGDILGGGGGIFLDNCIQNNNTGLDPTKSPGNKIAAALLFGDMRHTASQSYNVGTGKDKQGSFPRSADQVKGLARFSSVLRSYCMEADPICARGDNGTLHETYFDRFSEDAADWIADKLGLPPVSKTSSATVTATASTTDSATQSATTTSASSFDSSDDSAGLQDAPADDPEAEFTATSSTPQTASASTTASGSSSSATSGSSGIAISAASSSSSDSGSDTTGTSGAPTAAASQITVSGSNSASPTALQAASATTPPPTLSSSSSSATSLERYNSISLIGIAIVAALAL